MRTKQIWEEILFPMHLESGKIVFIYRKHETEGTLEWLIEYNFESKKWTVKAWEVKNGKSYWTNRSKTKAEMKILVDKAIRHLEREMKDLRGREIAETVA